LVACHGMSVTTVEGVGTERKCVHQVQKRIATWWQHDSAFFVLVDDIRDGNSHDLKCDFHSFLSKKTSHHLNFSLILFCVLTGNN